MPPKKTLEERVRELEEQSKKSALVGLTIMADLFLFLVVMILLGGSISNFHRVNERLDRLEQSTTPSQEVP